MSKKRRFEAKVKGFHFPSLEGLIWHSGSFWLHGEKLKEVYNNGSKAILIGSTKHGLTKFRKEAQPCEVTLLDGMPF